MSPLIDETGVSLKLGRANKRRDDLLIEIRALGESQPLAILPEVNDDFTQYTFNVIEENRAPFYDWALDVGECLFDYRCALDHLVYSMAVAESGADPPPGERLLMFPIGRDRTAYKKAGWRIKTLCDDCQALIQSVQPYEGLGEEDPLVWLEDLHSADKHRLLTICYFAMTHGLHHFSGHIPGTRMTIWHATGMLKDGAPAIQVTLDRPNPNMQVDLDLDIQVAINQGSNPEAGIRGSAELILNAISARIEEVIGAVRSSWPH